MPPPPTSTPLLRPRKRTRAARTTLSPTSMYLGRQRRDRRKCLPKACKELPGALVAPMDAPVRTARPGEVELRIVTQFLQEGVDVAAPLRLDAALHHLDVLLRHRLLREPGGFEGPVAILVEPQADCLAVAKGPNVDRAVVERKPRVPRLSCQAHGNDDALARVNDLLGVAAQVVEDRRLSLNELDESFASMERALQNAHLDNDVRINAPHQRQKLLAARKRRVHRFVALADGLDVLLRHRLLPQPGGFEGAVLVEVRREANHLAVAEGPDVEAMVPKLGLAPRYAPAVVHLGHHALLVGVDHLFELDVEVLKGL